MTKNSFFSRSVLASALFLLAQSAFAVIDTAPVTAAMADGAIAVGVIGGAVLTVWAIRKVYGMISGGK